MLTAFIITIITMFLHLSVILPILPNLDADSPLDQEVDPACQEADPSPSPAHYWTASLFTNEFYKKYKSKC